MDISRGPCIERTGPRGGRRKPLVSKWDQWNDPPERMAVLFTLLSDAAAEPWSDRRSEGNGSLFRFGATYAECLAAVGPVYPPDADRDRAYRDLAAAWLHAASWPTDQTAAAVEQRLSAYAHQAILARTGDLGLHYWFGPEVPLRVLVSGTSMQSWEALQKEKARRSHRCR